MKKIINYMFYNFPIFRFAKQTFFRDCTCENQMNK